MFKIFKRAQKEESFVLDENLEFTGNTSKLLKSIDDKVALATARTFYDDNLSNLSDFDEEGINSLKRIGYAFCMISRGFHVNADDLSNES